MKRVAMAILLLVTPTLLLIAMGGGERGKEAEVMQVSWSTPSPVDDDAYVKRTLEEMFDIELVMWRQDAESLNIRVASGEIPDKMAVHISTMWKFAEQDILAEIPLEFLGQHAPNIHREYTERLPSLVLGAATVDGRLVGLPFPNPESGSTRPPIVWRADWLENVDISKVPETLAEFEAAIYSFTYDDPDENGVQDTYGMSSSMLSAIYGAYGYEANQWFESDGLLAYGGVQPEMKDALALLAKWYQDGVISPDFVTLDEGSGGPGLISLPFSQGQIGVSAYSRYLEWKPAQFEGDREGPTYTELMKTNPAAEVVYGLPPTGPAGNRGIAGEAPSHPWISVFGKPLEDHPERFATVLQMMDYLATEEGFLLSRFGGEGVHYQWQEGLPVGEGRLPVPVSPYEQWQEITKIGGGNIFNIWFAFVVRPVNADLMWLVEQHPELYEDAYLDAATFKRSPTRTEMEAELEKLQDETYVNIITGRSKIDAFDEFVEDWYNIGGRDITDELNQ